MYDIPPIFAILGPQGSGKTYSAFKVICEFADRNELDLAFNFSIDLAALYYYCIACGYSWLASRVYYNHCKFICSDNLEEFMPYPGHIYFLDEAGAYMNSRDFRSISKNFMHDLAQIRHDKKILIWIAQYHDQVDRMLRELTQGFCQCESQLRFDKKMGSYKITWQRLYIYNSRQYKLYLQKVYDKCQGLRYFVNSRRLSKFHYEGFLSQSDKLIFEIYQSFGYRVGQQMENSPDPLWIPYQGLKKVSYSESEFLDGYADSRLSQDGTFSNLY